LAPLKAESPGLEFNLGSPLRWVHFARRFIFGGGSRLRADYQTCFVKLRFLGHIKTPFRKDGPSPSRPVELITPLVGIPCGPWRQPDAES
jgi:hypothetical protein